MIDYPEFNFRFRFRGKKECIITEIIQVIFHHYIGDFRKELPPQLKILDIWIEFNCKNDRTWRRGILA